MIINMTTDDNGEYGYSNNDYDYNDKDDDHESNY